MKLVFLIQFGNKAFLSMPPRRPDPDNRGWKPYVWTRDINNAEKFPDAAHAMMWGNNILPHSDWTVVSRPFGPATGGSSYA